MDYVERLRELREDADLNQTSVAAIIGVAQTYYSKQERHDKPFTIPQLIRLCQYYGVSADYILGLPKGLSWPR